MQPLHVFCVRLCLVYVMFGVLLIGIWGGCHVILAVTLVPLPLFVIICHAKSHILGFGYTPYICPFGGREFPPFMSSDEAGVMKQLGWAHEGDMQDILMKPTKVLAHHCADCQIAACFRTLAWDLDLVCACRGGCHADELHRSECLASTARRENADMAWISMVIQA